MAHPKTMKAAVIERFGGPEVLTVQTVPVPVPERGEVLIAIHTAGVGPWDADIRAGWWPEAKPKFPLILGTDGSGTIVVGGSGFAAGDKVYSYSFLNPKGGFYAEYVAVAAKEVGRIPPGLRMKEAGAVPTIGLTALQGIDALKLRAGEVLVVLGASGGVGSMAVQFAAARGARVLAFASGPEGVKLVRRLGAAHAVDGHHADLVAAIRDFAPRGADALFATAGGEALQRAIEAVRARGRVAWPNGVEPEPDLSHRRDLVVHVYDAEPGRKPFERLGQAIVAAKLKVPIAAEFPLAEAAAAHRRLAQRPVLGKIVLRVR